MDANVSPELLAQVGELLGYPGVAVAGSGGRAGFTIAESDRESWLTMAGLATDDERAAWIVELGPALMGWSEESRARLAGARADWGSDVEVYLVGDLEALDLVRTALELVPHPARGVLQRETAFVATGFSSYAFNASGELVGADGRRKSRLIAISPQCDVLGLLHELSHGLHSPDESAGAIRAQGREALFNLAMAEGWLGDLRRYVDAHEAIADATALSWFYSRPDGAAS